MATNTKNTIDTLPYQLGIRLVLDSVSYTNSLPDWFEAPNILYAERERIVKRRITSYLAQSRPEPPLGISLPRKSGDSKLWAMPSVNDQIICQVCVSAITDELIQRCIDPEVVFSYRQKTNPDTLALCEDPISSWRAFQRETKRRCNSGDCVLQIDLEDAYHSMDRAKVIAFLRTLFPNRIEVDILQIMLDSFSADNPGLPLVNDSIFLLGNAYLSVVDTVVARHSKNYIRYVDDYRIFDASRDRLTQMQASLAPSLAQLGFRINAHKLRLSTAEEYLEGLSNVTYAINATDGSNLDNMAYSRSVVIGGMLPPDQLIQQIHIALKDPKNNLTEGTGRFLVGSMRRARLDAQIINGHSDGNNGRPPLREYFTGQLSSDNFLIGQVDHYLNFYAKYPDEVWRLTWLLYLCRDINFYQMSKSLAASLRKTLNNIQTASSIPLIARLWADNRAGDEGPKLGQIEKIHDQSYIKGGQLFLGG
jgi:hypothetical protein